MFKNYSLLYLLIIGLSLINPTMLFTQDSLPSIKLIIPKDTPVQCTKAFIPIKAIIFGIENKDDLEILLNDEDQRRFTFDTATHALRMQVGLKEEKNFLFIKAENNYGSAQYGLNINYQNPLSLLGPNIEIIYPEKSNFIVYRDTIRIKAIVEMVYLKDDIIIELNGRVIESFEHNSDNETVSVLLNLDAGENYIKISASNTGGGDHKTIKVIYRI